MLKHLYRGIVLLCVFAGSIYYFGRDIKEEVFNMEKTIEMSETSFPIITLRSGTKEFNLSHGYGNNINANIVRESITPLDSQQSFTVVIDEKENVVKRVIYELRSVKDNKLLETDTINALEKEDDKKTARIKFKAQLDEKVEYAVKITLVTSESRKMNYYTRIELFSSHYYDEKISFVMDFHNSIMDKKKAENIIIYLEPKKEVDNSSLSYVNIHSSFDLISWGNLQPQVMGKIVPTIKEISIDLASIELKYWVSAETDNGLEYYAIKEFYRVRYTSSRMYLLNYERSMESIFDMNLASVSKSELKIGITNQSEIDLVTSSDNNKLSFVRNGELWYYNLAENLGVKVFSFRQDETDYVRDIYSEHDVRILNMDEDGNIDFIVYGYMNRGVYEGRVGIVLYKFHSAEDRIEELVYIPINVTYQLLKEELNEFSYVNQLGTFYFTINHKVYAYNLITKGLTVIASNIGTDSFIVSKEQHYIAWEDSSIPSKTANIIILDLESGVEQRITAPTGKNVNLLGKIDNNIIYGYVNTKDITTKVDGSLLIPMHQIEIADAHRNVLKKYSKSGYYVTNAKVRENVINLERMVLSDEKGDDHYKLAESDSILNKATVITKALELTQRVTEKTLTELYVSLPADFVMKDKPKVNESINTIITEDTTLRIQDAEVMEEAFIVYAFGDITGIFSDASDAINQANEMVGAVLYHNQKIIWERIIKSTKTEINTITPIYTNGNIDSIVASAQMMIDYSKSGYSPSVTIAKESSIFEILSNNLGDSVLNLTGCTLDEVLYFINEDKPVLAMKDADSAVLIVGYDTYNITVIDPSLHKTMKIGLMDGLDLFELAGNIFFSYR